MRGGRAYAQPLGALCAEAETLETETDAGGATAVGRHLLVALLWEGQGARGGGGGGGP